MHQTCTAGRCCDTNKQHTPTSGSQPCITHCSAQSQAVEQHTVPCQPPQRSDSLLLHRAHAHVRLHALHDRLHAAGRRNGDSVGGCTRDTHPRAGRSVLPHCQNPAQNHHTRQRLHAWVRSRGGGAASHACTWQMVRRQQATHAEQRQPVMHHTPHSATTNVATTHRCMLTSSTPRLPALAPHARPRAPACRARSHPRRRPPQWSLGWRLRTRRPPTGRSVSAPTWPGHSPPPPHTGSRCTHG